MTREEAVIILDGFKNNPLFNDTHAQALEMAISALFENKGEWIPVSERLPETHQDVLLELRSGEMLTGFKAETEPYFYCHGVDGCYVEPQNVIAWMPLPEPYKPEKIRCNTCKNNDDELSGECYECIKGIFDHYEPEEVKTESEDKK